MSHILVLLKKLERIWLILLSLFAKTLELTGSAWRIFFLFYLKIHFNLWFCTGFPEAFSEQKKGWGRMHFYSVLQKPFDKRCMNLCKTRLNNLSIFTFSVIKSLSCFVRLMRYLQKELLFNISFSFLWNNAWFNKWQVIEEITPVLLLRIRLEKY